jgi:signal transduction histidine kinase
MTKNKENFFQKFAGLLTVENMREQVQWLVFLRWIAGIMVVVSVLAGKAFFHIETITVPLLLGIIILLYNFVFQLIRKYFMTHQEESKTAVKRRLTFINLQIFLDLIVLAALIYFTGGIVNPFLSFFIFHMVISSILLSRRSAYAWAFFTIILESMLFYLEHFNYIPHQGFLPGYPIGLVENVNHVMFILVAFSVTLLITVYFATSIMRPIRKRQLDLQELQNSINHKRALLEKSNEELSEMDKSKTEFLYRVEHELKAPIGALQGLISVVNRGYESVDSKKKKDLLLRAEGRICMMKELVSDLLSLSRINERSFKLNIQRVDLGLVIKDVVTELTGFSNKRDVPVNLEIADDEFQIPADKEAIIEVFRNLIHNAIKYSFEGEVKVTLSCSKDFIVIKVQDSGIGIGEDDLGHIFNDFFRTPNAKAFEEGSGLGLSLVKRLVEQHCGIISVTSELNKGSIFTVSLPIKCINMKILETEDENGTKNTNQN